MDKEKIENTIKEMLDLYNRGEYEKLSQIELDENETKEKILAAHVVLQLGLDSRRLI